MGIKNFPFSKLYKLELSNLATNAIQIIEKHDPETLLIEEVFDLLEAQKPNIDALDAPKGPHPITAQLVPVRKQLYMYAAALCYKMNFIVRDVAQEQTEEVRIAEIAINRHLRNLSKSKNQLLASEKVDKLFLETDQSQELESAFSSLGLTADLNELRNVNSIFKELYGRRLATKSQKPRVKTPILVKSISNALTNMFLQIRVAELKNTELDYSPLINELNDLLQAYRNLINIREGQSRRNAEGKDGNGNSEGENTTMNVEPTGPAARMMMNLNAADTNGEGEKILPINEKKTIAPTSNSMQLPLNDNEAKNDANTN